MNSPIPLLTPKPGHVPDELVVDYDYVRPAGMEEVGVYNAVKRLHDGPDIIWSPRHGGHWMVTRAEDIRFVQENYERSEETTSEIQSLMRISYAVYCLKNTKPRTTLNK